MLNGLDLFSGIGGLTKALHGFVFPRAYCEIDPYCQSVLLSRMQEGDLPKAPIWDDIRTFPTDFKIPIDIIYGGFPCTDISVAGHGKGLDGEHSGLFFEILRLAKEIKSKYLFLENVPALTTRGGLQVVKEIASVGYDCRWCIISASGVGTIHKRDRWFLLANSDRERVPGLPGRKETVFAEFRSKTKHTTWDEWTKDESPLLRKTDDVPFRVDRIKALGNSVVPLQARKAFKELIGI